LFKRLWCEVWNEFRKFLNDSCNVNYINYIIMLIILIILIILFAYIYDNYLLFNNHSWRHCVLKHIFFKMNMCILYVISDYNIRLNWYLIKKFIYSFLGFCNICFARTSYLLIPHISFFCKLLEIFAWLIMFIKLRYEQRDSTVLNRRLNAFTCGIWSPFRRMSVQIKKEAKFICARRGRCSLISRHQRKRVREIRNSPLNLHTSSTLRFVWAALILVDAIPPPSPKSISRVSHSENSRKLPFERYFFCFLCDVDTSEL